MRFLRQEIRLKARDVLETIAFYRDVLWFSVDSVWGPEDAPEGCILDQGGVHLLFHTDETPQPKMTGVLVIEVENVLALHMRIRDRVKVLWGPEVYDYGMREFAIEDPNGYHIAFCERTDEQPSWSR